MLRAASCGIKYAVRSEVRSAQGVFIAHCVHDVTGDLSRLDAARQSVAEFVRKWVLKQSDWNGGRRLWSGSSLKASRSAPSFQRDFHHLR